MRISPSAAALGALLSGLVLAACAGPSPPASPQPASPQPPAAPSLPAATAPSPGAVPPAAPTAQTVDAATLPGPAREFRAAWIATVANIDWPSRAGLPAPQQQAELRALLDRARDIGLNAVVFQVRPMADALYASALEPWSEVLTGRQGQHPGYDPLQFAIEEAHARGLELHAWFNPYRAGHPSETGRRAETHFARRRPDLVRRYGDFLWLDPGAPEAAEHSLAVILDVVRRYDLDGVHMDDYFYPYPVQRNGRRVPFPDDATYAAARAAGETLGRDDWRRQNVDRFIERFYREVKAAKPHVQVGISPFGIWRPGHPPQITGFDQYAEIYADARKWQQEGWLDYFAPQLYWSIDSRGQSFPVLLDWWAEQNMAGRHLWPGLYTSRILPDVGTWQPREILEQVRITQAHPVATGAIHFSMKALLEPHGAGRGLAAGPYATPALTPASPWLGGAPPPHPLVHAEAGAHVRLAPGEGSGSLRAYVLRARFGEAWQWQIVPAAAPDVPLPRRDGRLPDALAVSAIDRAGLESPAVVVPLAGP